MCDDVEILNDFFFFLQGRMFKILSSLYLNSMKVYIYIYIYIYISDRSIEPHVSQKWLS